ncbi:response regulator transcription factor [Bradyrhizobium cenepequi]
MTAPMISIVDDDQSVRDGLVDLLTSMGFDVKAFEVAEHFLRSSRVDCTSCLITDVRMPGMNGLELHDRLLASGKRIPTIVITAFPTDAERARALEAGVAGYLTKPFDDNELVACIHTLSVTSPPANRRPS